MEWRPAVSWDLNSPDLLELLDSNSARLEANYYGEPSRQGGLARGLTTVMSEQLRSGEQVNAAQKKELKEKAEVIMRLQTEATQLRAVVGPEVRATLRRMHAEADKVRLKAEEIEQFLSKYGSKWVEGRLEGELDTTRLQQDLAVTERRHKDHLPSQIDIRVIQRRVQELNLVAEQDASRWVADGAVHVLRAPDPVSIFFYQNGLVLQGFDFRPYSSHEARSLLSDLLEGYFPHDLQLQFPDGVPLKAVDCTSQLFTGQLTPGLKSADQSNPAIKSGMLRPTGSRVEVAEELVISSETRSDRMTTLRIKTESGAKTLVVKMSYDDTLEDLRRVIAPYRDSTEECALVSSFPSRTFMWSDSGTLEQLELVPNYALMLRLAYSAI
jgi:hypothetical protein